MVIKGGAEYKSFPPPEQPCNSLSCYLMNLFSFLRNAAFSSVHPEMLMLESEYKQAPMALPVQVENSDFNPYYT